MKLNCNVGDEVYVKMTVERIERTDCEDDFNVKLSVPDWMFGTREDCKPSVRKNYLYLRASQHLIFGEDGT